MCIYLNKSKVFTRLQDEKAVLYNYVTNILLDRIFNKKIVSTEEKIVLVASRKETNKFLNTNFKNYLPTQCRNNHQVDMEVKIKTPHEEKCLQAVDFVSWAVFRKYEFGDEQPITNPLYGASHAQIPPICLSTQNCPEQYQTAYLAAHRGASKHSFF